MVAWRHLTAHRQPTSRLFCGGEGGPMRLLTVRAAIIAALGSMLLAVGATPAVAQPVGWADSTPTVAVPAGAPATLQAPGSGPLGYVRADYTPTTRVVTNPGGPQQVPVYRTDPVYDWVATYGWDKTYTDVPVY